MGQRIGCAKWARPDLTKRGWTLRRGGRRYRLAIDSGFRIYFVYAGLSAAYAQAGKMDEAKAALAEARRLNPKLSVKWITEHYGDALSDGLRKAGPPEGE